MRRYIRVFDHIVAISHYVAAQVVQYFPEAEGKISVIYNGADKLPPVEAGYEPVYRPPNPFLFTIGVLSPRKNFHVLPALLENNNLELVVAGIVKEDYRDKVLEEAKLYNCLDRVKIIGTISDQDKAFYYQNCQALVFPSLAEGFGLPVIEAMYFGKQVFLSRLTSLPEIGGEEAFYFDNFEPRHMQDVFAKGMKTSQDPTKRLRLQERAKGFSWNNAASSYLKLYKEVLFAK
jgi:glycosyltransferase involved in cell wall biosynthesis